jgi:hypothetical protein
MALFVSLFLAAGADAQGVPPRVFSWIATLQLGEEMAMRSPIAVAAIGDDGLAVAEVVPDARLLEFRRGDGGWSLIRTVSLPSAPADLAHDGERLVIALRKPGGLVALVEGADTVEGLPLDREIIPGHLAAARGGHLLVHDLANDRIVEFGGDLRLVRQADVPAGVTGLATTPSGGFLIALGAEGRIVRYDGNWRSRETWELAPDNGKPAWPSGLYVSANGEALVLDRHGGRLLALDSNGRWIGIGSRRGWDPGLLWFPADVASLTGGLIAVADEGNGRVQIFRRTTAGGVAE